MDAELEKLLADDEEEKVVETKEEAAASESTAEGKDDELAKVKAENERLRKATKTLNTKLKEKEAPQETKVEAQDKFKTQEDWLKHIDEVAEKKANEKFSVLKENSLKKAKAKFVASHPEYASSTEEGKAKLRSILERASALGLSDKTDESEMTETLLDAWAVENRKELELAAQERDKSRARARQVAAQAAGSGDSEKLEDDFTEAEREEADQYGKTPEKMRQIKKLLEKNSVNV